MSIGDPDSYSVNLPTLGLSSMVDEGLMLAATLQADGTPAQASLVRQAIIRLEADLEEAARKVSVLAEKSIKDAELSSRKRPLTGRSPGLNDFVGVSHPLPTVPGSVGINYEPVLYANVPWWWTNEEGYSGNLGMKFIGAFGDAGFTNPTRPDPNRSREHPLLRVGKGKNTGKGTIKNPIPAREFVKDGAAIATVAWHAQIRAAKTRFMRECGRANAASLAIKRQRTAKATTRRRRP